MPVFSYKGVTAGSRSASGTIDAESLRAARSKLRADGIFPTKIVEGSGGTTMAELIERFKLPDFSGVPDLDLALFAEQLSTLLKAGVPIVDSLEALVEQIDHVRLKAIVGKLREDVNQGTSLADAMKLHPKAFDTLFQSMVRAGESSGTLSLVLGRLGEYVEARRRLRNQVVGAMTYPSILLGMSVIVMGILLVKVIPSLSTMLVGLNQELPAATLAVIALSEFMIDWWPALVTGALALAFSISQFLKTERGRRTWDRFAISAPALGRTIRFIAISRFSRTLATLLAGGVNIVQAFEIARSVTGNVVIGDAVDRAKEAITQGASIGPQLRQSGEFPAMVTHMVSVGEASGELDAMLGKVADTYDEMVKNSLDRLVTLLGPILLLFVAVVIVVIVLSTLQPLMNLTRNL